ncbi:hypothetical protein BDQ12DRAFT_717553 [Crucibulum laeve]|uniref:Uncharacterized protein n=1 Tax=Crucibulum laeve TaxID=68775 RepID=A0A5C3MHJ7_9AGAR|nr:hypothetical protein BDQ12DRAFT_717553 [Crucibulum laeve]
MAEEPMNTTRRYYVDCAIQTDMQNRHIASPNSRHSLTSCSSPLSTNSRPTSRPNEISNKVSSNIAPLRRSIVLDSSPTNKEALSTRAVTSNIRSSQHSSSHYKHSDLLYARPSGSRTSEIRVISLPEASSVFKVKAEGTMRVVSMPDCIHPSFPQSSPSMDRSYIELSGSTGTMESNFDDSFVEHHRLKLSNLPQTPSPPSSPESVMIINHSANVPRSFLSKKQASYDAYTDEDGK